MWKETFNLDTMLLHAHTLDFIHPVTQAPVQIKANVQKPFERALKILDPNLILI